jgi:ornithine decarboxylase
LASGTGGIMQNFATLAEAIARLRPRQPLMCLCPEAARANARQFVAGFPGEVHYAVKANPLPNVARWLHEGGVRGFDVASIAEMEMLRAELGDVHLAFNHPVKSRADIDTAYRQYGVRDFVIDHPSELEKLKAICGTDITVQVRIARANPDSAVDLNAKFGCDGQTAAALLREAAQHGFDVALAMHVGWQAREPKAWAEAMAMGAGAAQAAGVTLKYANLGGGYPSVLMPAGRTLDDFFKVIREAAAEHLPDTPLNCEPGSALVWDIAATVAQVVLRKDDAVYLNDGVYGAMCEVKFTNVSQPAVAFDAKGVQKNGERVALTVFGPTCDSLDQLPAPVMLPSDLTEDDYVAFGWMGAYSNALLTSFNGLGQLDYVTVDELPSHPRG